MLPAVIVLCLLLRNLFPAVVVSVVARSNKSATMATYSVTMVAMQQIKLALGNLISVTN